MFSHTAIQAKSKHKALTYLHYITTEVPLIEYLDPSIIIGICGLFTFEVTNLNASYTKNLNSIQDSIILLKASSLHLNCNLTPPSS